ncbi:MAG TPA: 3-phosphoshikimate 1-carboxyvinyltransferase [Bacteroidia bacterium]|nr:3-phosphoshikimate 1-carboxyvinyltransferase [Bacteroidia bacterium]
MIYQISKKDKNLIGTIHLTTSKSESNRVLIIQQLCKDFFEIKKIAQAQDTETMKNILAQFKKNNFQTDNTKTYDVGAAGTTMRFLCAFFATQKGTHILTGSDRMQKRPIKILVDALRELGAKIDYLGQEGFPPLKIEGRELKGGEIVVAGNVSSQYISALLLIAPVLFGGITIRFEGVPKSRPYINMTLKIMEYFGVYGNWHDNSISISKQDYYVEKEQAFYNIEGDWSAASYWYSMAALAENVDLKIMGLKKESWQGDSVVAELFSFFGVKTTFIENGIYLTKMKAKEEHFGFDFSDCPDIVQTVAVTASALKITFLLNGLSTLKIKETDRIQALINEFKKIDIIAKEALPNTLEVRAIPEKINSETVPCFATYEDHRMAMAFSAFAFVYDKIKIEHPEVVIKSYPNFWNDLKAMKFEVKEIG